MKNPNAKFHAPEHDHRYEQAVNEHEDREARKHAIPDSWITDAPEPIEPEKPVMLLLVEALQCAEYALTHPQSDQQFALNAVRDAISVASNLETSASNTVNH